MLGNSWVDKPASYGRITIVSQKVLLYTCIVPLSPIVENTMVDHSYQHPPRPNSEWGVSAIDAIEIEEAHSIGRNASGWRRSSTDIEYGYSSWPILLEHSCSHVLLGHGIEVCNVTV